MRKNLFSQQASIGFALVVVVLAQCLMVQLVAFSEDKDQPKYPSTIEPRETIVDEKEKEREKLEPKTPRMVCGKCPEGYVKTAEAAPESGTAPGANFNETAEMCKTLSGGADSRLVECKPIGYQNQMPVCGTCPEGYREIGRTFMPHLCGKEDGGLRTQCQVPNMQGGMPDPTKGGRRCPPDCVGNLPTPGDRNDPPHPPKFPSVEIRKEKPAESP